MSKRELTNEQQAMSQLYSVLVAIVASDNTPKHTAEATIQTLQKLFEDADGPFQADEHMIGMTMAMAESMNDIVRNKNKRIRANQGSSILDSMNWN